MRAWAALAAVAHGAINAVYRASWPASISVADQKAALFCLEFLQPFVDLPASRFSTSD
jgi:hypothetical protein